MIRDWTAADTTPLAAATDPVETAVQRFDLGPPASVVVDAAPGLSPQAADRIADPAHHRWAAGLVRDAALALHHAHERGVVHRDVKPGNLMVGRDGHVKVIDFGIARFFEDHTLTRTGELVGTLLYMGPEQATGRIRLTPATDVYSLGLVLIELLILRPPIAVTNLADMLQQVVTKPLAPLTRLNPSVPRELEAVVHMAAAKDPDARYRTAGAFAADLQAWLDGKPVAARPYRLAADELSIAAARPGWTVGLAAYQYLLAALPGYAALGLLISGALYMFQATSYAIKATSGGAVLAAANAFIIHSANQV